MFIRTVGLHEFEV